MRPIEVNLSRNPYRNDTVVALVLTTLLIAAVGLSAYNVYSFVTLDSRKSRLQGELAGHRQRMAEMKVRADDLRKQLDGVDYETVESQANFVAAILAERNFSWTSLFNALEDEIPWNVKLLSIRPYFREKTVTIALTGVARDFSAFLGLQEALQAAPEFASVEPGDYQRYPDDRVQFALNFVYRAPSLEPPPAEPQIAAADGAPGGGAAAAEGEEPEVAVAEGVAAAGEPAPQRPGATESGMGAPAAQASDPTAGAAAPGGPEPVAGRSFPPRRRPGAAGGVPPAPGDSGTMAAGDDAGQVAFPGAAPGVRPQAPGPADAGPNSGAAPVMPRRARGGAAVPPPPPGSPPPPGGGGGQRPPDVVRDEQGRPTHLVPRVKPPPPPTDDEPPADQPPSEKPPSGDSR